MDTENSRSSAAKDGPSSPVRKGGGKGGKGTPPRKGGFPGQGSSGARGTGKGPPPGAKGRTKRAGGGGGSGKGAMEARKKAKAARRKKIMAGSKPLNLSRDRDDPNEFVLSRFIINPWGQQLGESIGVEGKNLIMKKGLKFYSIPIAGLREYGADLVVTTKLDWAASLALGEKWRKATLELPSPKPLFEKSKELERGDEAKKEARGGEGGRRASGQSKGGTDTKDKQMKKEAAGKKKAAK